jgi:hypothetical protein
MWSRGFLLAGCASAVVIVAAALALIWLAIFILTGSRDPTFTPVNMALSGLAGLLAYPACWYLVVFQARRNTRARTALLLALTDVVSCALVGLLLAASAAYRPPAPHRGGAMSFAINLTAMGAILLAVPFALIGTPMAFLHRALLQRWFGAANDRRPNENP